MVTGVQKFFRRTLADIVYFLIKFVKRLFMMPDGTCRYTPTCSQYSREALATLPLHQALPKIIKRVSSCHPRGGYGHDPVHAEEKSDE